MKEVVTNIDHLREIALDQHGFVTREQAYNEGISAGSLAMLAKRGRLERVACGVFRIPQVPASGYGQLMLAVLWTGAEEATLSHETALAVYGLSDVNPTLIHITVGKVRRINRKGGEGYQLHHENTSPDDVGWWHGIPIVKPAIAIRQCIVYGTPSYLIDQAIKEGVKRRLINRREAEALRMMLDERNESYPAT